MFGDQGIAEPRPQWSDRFHPIPGRTSKYLAKVLDRGLLHDRTVWVLIAIGWFVRICQYLANRSLWLDEAFLAPNLTNRTYAELLAPLDFHQHAPIGFLMAVRFCVQAFGTSEYALRLVPLMCGLLAVPLMALVARRTLPREAANFSIALFALADPLIYYASESKQYSADIFVTLLIFFSTLWLMEKRNIAAFVSYALVGFLSVWFSHPSVLVMAGMGLSVLFHFLVRREWKHIAATCAVIALWLLSFGFAYLGFMKTPATSQGLRDAFSLYFLRFPPGSIKELYSYVKFFFQIFYEILGIPLTGIAALFFLLGFVALWRQRSAGSWLTLPPMLVTLAISCLGYYPFRARFSLFLVPLVVILIGAGAGLVWTRTRGVYPVIGLMSLGLLYFYPVSLGVYHVLSPRINQELRPVLASARGVMQAGDTVCVHSLAMPALQYYLKELQFQRNFEVIEIHGGRERIFDYIDDMEKVRGRRRVWFVFTHADSSEGLDHELFFLAYLRQIGTQLWERDISNPIQKGFEHNRSSASMYLFDLSRSRGPGDPPIEGSATKPK